MTYAVGFGDGITLLVTFKGADTVGNTLCGVLLEDALDIETTDVVVRVELLVALRVLKLNEELELGRELVGRTSECKITAEH